MTGPIFLAVFPTRSVAKRRHRIGVARNSCRCFDQTSGIAELLLKHDETRGLVVPHLDTNAAAELICKPRNRPREARQTLDGYRRDRPPELQHGKLRKPDRRTGDEGSPIAGANRERSKNHPAARSLQSGPLFWSGFRFYGVPRRAHGNTSPIPEWPLHGTSHLPAHSRGGLWKDSTLSSMPARTRASTRKPTKIPSPISLATASHQGDGHIA